MKTHPHKGNVLFLILLAVALFAALSYAVTRGERGGVVDVTKEKLDLWSSEIIQYATLMEQTVTRLRLSNGCRDTQISFQRDWDGDGTIEDNADDQHNGFAPNDGRCHVFDVNGGALPYQAASTDWLDPAQSTATTYGNFYFHGGSCIRNVGTSGTGGPSAFCDSDPAGFAELFMMVSGLREELCASINERLIGDPTIPVDAVHSHSRTSFYGTYDGARETSDTAGLIDGNHTLCFQGNPTSDFMPSAYHFYHILIAR
tara:strand:+ start:790 stop:1563 length:774 start_codon:yes stop_codon:yes gene_type:complete